MAEKEHHLTKAKRLREEAAALAAVEGSVDSVAPDVELVEEYRVMNKRGDIAYYASSRKEADEKLPE